METCCPKTVISASFFCPFPFSLMAILHSWFISLAVSSLQSTTRSPHLTKVRVDIHTTSTGKNIYLSNSSRIYTRSLTGKIKDESIFWADSLLCQLLLKTVKAKIFQIKHQYLFFFICREKSNSCIENSCISQIACYRWIQGASHFFSFFFSIF